MDPVSAHFQHTNLGVPTPFAKTNEFEYLPHTAVSSFWLTFYSDQILLFRLELVFSFGFGGLILAW